MTSKGQITIPKTVRDALNLKTGDRLNFVLAGYEFLVVPRNRAMETLFGRLAGYARPQTVVGDYDAAIAEGIGDHVASAGTAAEDAA